MLSVNDTHCTLIEGSDILIGFSGVCMSERPENIHICYTNVLPGIGFSKDYPIKR